MSPIEAYKLLLSKVNKNDTNTNVKVPKSIFILLFNEQKRKWLDKYIKDLESSDGIEDVEEILVLDQKLEFITDSSFKTDFKQPEDFMKRVSGFVEASKDDCKNIALVGWFVKPKDLNVLLQNQHHKPSFEYQETLGIINNGKVSFYKDNFTINNAYLTYYREPKDLDIQGYKKLDGSLSINQETGLSKINMEKIIDAVALEVVRNYESPEQFQLALQRKQENIEN